MRNPLTIRQLQDIRKSYNPDIMFLIETKNDEEYVHTVCKELRYAYHFVIPSIGLSGGLAIFWDETVHLSFARQPTLNYTDIYITEDSVFFCLTYIYGHPERTKRHELWKQMKDMVGAGLYSGTPRLVIGDLNDIASNAEKLGGPKRAESSFLPFRSMINTLGLHAIKTFGGMCTWAGQRHCHTVKSMIDRVLATSDWQDLFPRAYAKLLQWQGSDHRPLLLFTSDRGWKGKKMFRYENRWNSIPEVDRIVKQTWSTECSDITPEQLSIALQRCRGNLARWRVSSSTNSQKNILQLRALLQQEYDRFSSKL